MCRVLLLFGPKRAAWQAGPTIGDVNSGTGQRKRLSGYRHDEVALLTGEREVRENDPAALIQTNRTRIAGTAVLVSFREIRAGST
jgi:hypothetical protein